MQEVEAGKQISILIPCRNEEKYIGKCLDSVLAFELPVGVSAEILILDGNSSDRTKELAEEYARRNRNVRYLLNENTTQSWALNKGVKAAKGAFILRLDAHTFYPKDYLCLCYETRMRIGADNVGGVCITERGSDTYGGSVVQALSTHKFGVGNSGFRVGASEGEADTVPYGFFDRSVFDKVGLFDTRLERAQDYEFNRRIKRHGGRIWLNPAIKCYYHNQPSFTAFIKKQFYREAPYNAYMWYVAPYSFHYRHGITLLFSTGVIAGAVLSFLSGILAAIYLSVVALYFLLAMASSVQQAVRFREVRHVLVLPFCFFAYHFLHGVGVAVGVANLVLGISPVQNSKQKT